MKPSATRTDRLRALLWTWLALLAGVGPAGAGPLADRERRDERVSACCIEPEAACCPDSEAPVPATRILPRCCGVDAPADAPEAPPESPRSTAGDAHERCRERIAADATRSAAVDVTGPLAEAPRLAAPAPPASREGPSSLLHRRASRGSRVVLAQLSVARI